MLMKISEDLRSQQIWAEGNELVYIMGRDRDASGKRITQRPYSEKELVAEIMDPVLLTDNHRISLMEPAKRDTVFSLYQSFPRTTEYDGVSVSWDPRIYKNVWGPSIDTVVFAKAMKDSCIFGMNIDSMVDIGCASGFLGKYSIEKCPQIVEAHFVDLNPYAVKCAEDNVRKKIGKKKFKVMDGLDLKGKFDLVICNPPYVPRPDGIDGNQYEGFGLMREMIANVKSHVNSGGMLVTNYSSLCEKVAREAIDAAEKSGATMKHIGTMRVPLKVNPILNNKEWLDYLIRNGLERKMEKGYEFFHTINIIEVDC
jgi:predicted RNA methylase